MSSSLIPERPLLISPTLAATIGLEETVMLHVLSEMKLRMPVMFRDNLRWLEVNLEALSDAMPFWHLHLQRGKRRRPIEPRLARRAVRGHATGVLTARHPTGLRGAALRLWNGATRHPPCPPCLKEGRLQVEPSQTHPVQQIPARPRQTMSSSLLLPLRAAPCLTRWLSVPRWLQSHCLSVSTFTRAFTFTLCPRLAQQRQKRDLDGLEKRLGRTRMEPVS